MTPDTQPNPPFSTSDIDEIRERLLDGESSRHLAEEYSTRERDLLRAARGVLDYTHDASHPPVNYDPDTGEWFVPEEHQQDPDPSPYTIEGELLWVPEWQIQPWAREDSEDAVDEDTTGRESELEATTTTMTNTTTSDSDTDADADADASSTEQTQTQTTIGNGNGETVAGTSPDDWGEIKTEAWPSHIDPENVNSNLRREIIQTAAMHREWGQSQIAGYVGCTAENVSLTLKDHWPDHHICDPPESRDDSSQEDQDTGDNSSTNSSEQSLAVDEVDDIRRRLLGGEERDSLAQEFGVSSMTITNAARGNGVYEDGPTLPPVGYDQSARGYRPISDTPIGNDDSSTGTVERDGTLPENEFGSDSPQLTLPSSIDLDDLSRDLERRIISVALEHPGWGQPEIADEVECLSYKVSEMLRVYWPTHPSVQSTERDRPVTTADVDTIRNRLLNGDTRSDIADDLEISTGGISCLAKGEYSIGDAANIPPVIHNQSAGGWVIADGGDGSDTIDNPDQDAGAGDDEDPENDGSEEWTNEPALTADEVNEIRKRLVAGESAGTLAVDYSTQPDTISKAAKGLKSYSRNASHPPVEYDRSVTEWVIAEDGDELETADSLGQDDRHTHQNTPSLIIDAVDDFRERLVAGETIHSIANDYNVYPKTVRIAAKGDVSGSRNTAHPPVVYNNSTGEWTVADDTDEPETEGSPDSDIDTTSSDPKLVALEYGADIYHHLDDADDICCGSTGDDSSLIRLEQVEADKVADECELCEKLSRSRDDLLTAIRNEIGADPDSSGKSDPLSKKELVGVLDILSRRDQNQGAP